MTQIATIQNNGHAPLSTEGAGPEGAQLDIVRIAAETLSVPIIGTAPLIMHRFSEKAKRQMLDAQQGRKSPKQTRDPKVEYEAAFYRLGDGYGFPTLAFKQCTVKAARFYGKDVSMAGLQQFLFFTGATGTDGQLLTEIVGEPRMREDVVRVGRGAADLRYRPEFTVWSARLVVTYVQSALTRGSVLSLIDAGGMGIGIGDYRPERKGAYGTFQIDSDASVEVTQ